jgi:tetratricopeptide (TPR) repeat protein
MKNLVLLIIVIAVCAGVFGQDPTSEVAKKTSENLEKAEKPAGEKEEFENAIGQTLARDRIPALQKFVRDFPESTLKRRAREVIVSSRAELADEKIRLGEIEEGVALFKLAVEEAPTPISDKLFSGLLVKFPANLFFRGQRAAAISIAKTIEEKTPDNPKHLLGPATFYLSVERAADALRLAEKSIEIEPESAGAYHTVGFAHRLNFELEKAAEAFSKAAGIDAESSVSKISLAEMKRALGKPDEASTLYREVLEKEPTNATAQTGLVLSLFDEKKKEEAEAALSASLEQNPKNLVLLVGASYWYAAHDDGARAVELARKVLEFERRYTWSYIALARGLMKQGDPLAAERILLAARQFGNFPTLEYELASARFAAGFYKEAADGLSKSFIVEDGSVKTKLGGRIEKTAEEFIELLSLERRASIFQFTPADDAERSRQMKKLLHFSQVLASDQSEDSEFAPVADSFIDGEDKMKTHRQLFAANQLLQKKKALAKVVEITKDAVFGVDSALDVPVASAAVMAEALYDSRRTALAKGESVIVPEVPRQTLSKIVRGRIEEIAGWALFQQDSPIEAISKLKLATTVLPRDSAWSRSTYWKLGTILESEGQSAEALNAYIKAYEPGDTSSARKLVIENLYGKLNGSLEGLEERLQNRESADSAASSIFTSKPSEEDSKSVTGDDSVKDDEAELKSENDLNSSVEKVPESVPVAKSTPSDIPSSDTDSNVADKPGDNGTKPVSTKESNSEIGKKDDLPENGRSSTADTILNPKDNISFIPAIIDDKSIDTPKTETEEKSVRPRSVDSIFAPIVIEVPKTRIPVKKTEDAKTTDPGDGDPTKESSNPKADKPLAEENVVKDMVPETPVKVEAKTKTEDSTDDNGRSGLERPRIVSEDKTVKDPSKPDVCELLVSQEELTIINGGGSLGVLVGFKSGKGDLKDIKAISSSPADVEVVFEPGIGSQSERAFFVIKSISSSLGLFNVLFDTPCGKKLISVKVR